MEEKIRKLLARLAEVEGLLGEATQQAGQKVYRELTQEHAYLSRVKETWEERESCARQLEEARLLQKKEEDPAFLEIIQEEIAQLHSRQLELTKALETLLVPPDPRDSRNIILELRAGTGGDEAALFVGDCVRMYKCYADKNSWKYELLSASPSEIGGFKEYILQLSGHNVHRLMQYEAGTHRV
ncbi:MAG: PCRF domain-containing protein, partial [Chlamydiae bacterium]|nr:PCRF domain-containing protein [Chlamydiota bacterium]